MMIELLIVAAILLYLNAVGFVDFTSSTGITLCIVITLVVLGVSWFFMHFILTRVIDGFFGFSSPPAKPAERVHMETLPQTAETGVPELLARIQKHPADSALSRRLSENYLDRGMIDEYVAERLRIIKAAKLSMTEICSIYNRLADVEMQRHCADDALRHLNEIIERFPRSQEADNARRRVQVISDAWQVSR